MNPFHVILSLYNYWILFHCEVIFELRFPAVIPLGEEKKTSTFLVHHIGFGEVWGGMVL